MPKNGRLHPRITIAMTAAWLAFAGPALADDEKPIAEPRHKLTADALVRAEKPETSEESWLRNFHLKKKRGFEYSHTFALSPERKGIFNIQGPIIKKKTLGLVFEVRF